MAKKTKVIEETPVRDRTVNGFVAENGEKWNRAIHGTVTEKGNMTGGVGDAATLEAKLVEYDRLGGLITKDGRKIKIGCFYDFDEQKPFEKPEPVLEFRIDNELVEVPVGDALPVEIQAKEMAAEKKSGKKKKPTVEDEE